MRDAASLCPWSVWKAERTRRKHLTPACLPVPSLGEPRPHLELQSGLLVLPLAFARDPCLLPGQQNRPLPLLHCSPLRGSSQQPAPHPGGPLLPHLPPAPCFVRKNLLSSSRSHCPHWIRLEVRASGQTAPDPREPGSLKSSCCISTASQPSLALGLFQNETKRACPSSPHRW